MSAVANSPSDRAVSFYDAYVGKKLVMAVTGVILFGYVVGHLLGNLQFFASSPDQINNYARFLHSHVVLLWVARIILLASVIVHITAATQLTLEKWAARPTGYYKKQNISSTYASRTMVWSGPIIAAFIVFHILHLTSGDVLPLDPENVYDNIVTGFQHPAVSVAYIVAMLLLGLHLYHGIWSMFQSVGVSHPRYTPWIKRFSRIFSILIVAGYISIPVSVMTGLKKPVGTYHATRRQSTIRPY